MSKKHKGADIYLERMVEACVKIREYVQNTTEENFLTQRESYDAICLQFSHLGEQINHLEESPDRTIQNFPDEVDWPGLKGLRNQIDHNYLKVDSRLIWQFAMSEVAEVENALRRILRKRYGKG
jgi:uncharacterized protein with HEPN domain